ncbi:MAG: hypothetical protein M3126_00120 [Candidatus Eremiobacteraeota bacterium]|nr:hypothetical protein [Candidatus Eremiobacteraeota bacterium]
MSLALVLFTLFAYATPVPPVVVRHTVSFRHIAPVKPALAVGASARIGPQGENIPCWDSPAALTAFTQAYQTQDRAAMALQVASDSFFLEEGTRVKALSTQGMLGHILRLKVLDGHRAGTVCYVSATLKIYTRVKRASYSGR